jgi:uroporphyrin-III C-methyltransferase / precorrin-2 dehydrogenase / sirohydrochlorin ferrochelatase
MSDRTPSEVSPPRMEPLARLPLFFGLHGKRAVIAGGSAAAAWKAELLSAAGAAVEVYTAEPSEEVLRIAIAPPLGPIAIIRRTCTDEDLRGAAIAIGAFDDDASSSEFAASARALGVPVNVIDKPAFCDFAFGAIVNRSPLVIGVSTDGAAPIFAQAIRAKLEALIPKGFSRWAAAAARWRSRLKRSGLSFAGRRKLWQRFTDLAVTHPDRDPLESDFQALVAEMRGLGTAVENGSVTLVGAGPGDPELLTLRAVRALQAADVILFDDLVSHEVLEFARREARKMLVGKSGYGPSCPQDEINTLMVKLAKSGKRVVRLKGGDPLVFGRAAEEIAACRDANIAVEIVPGITSAQGAAGALGVPLTDRKHARRLQYVTGHGTGGSLPHDVDWKSLADPGTTTAIYMPVRTLSELISKAIEQGLDPSTPAVAIANATRPDQAVIAAEIAALAARLSEAALNGPILVMLGRTFSGLQRLRCDDAASKISRDSEHIVHR